MTFEIPLIILAPDHHGGLLVPLVSNPFALAVTININELTEFISLCLVSIKGSAPIASPS